MHSVSDLTTSSRKTSGTVPPKLVGASTTIVGDKMYLFGGRLVAERRMVSDLYVFDLETFVWAKVPPHPADDVLRARYFHSADSWQNYLLIFGGMGHKPDAASSDDLIVLNDVRFFDLTTYRWLPAEPHSPGIEVGGAGADPIDPVATTPSSSNTPTTENNNTSRRNEFVPRARYAHLSAVTGSRLYIIGGQDLQNAWLDDICVYDLRRRKWAARRAYPRHAGTYRSVAVAAQLRVRDPSSPSFFEREGERTAHEKDLGLGPLGGRFNVDKRPPSSKGEYTPSENLVHLPYSTEPTDDFPNDIYLYSNYNFTDVKRELEVFSPKPDGDFEVTDRSASMTGTVLPPGLRFPTGAICGNHLLFAGTYLAHSYQSYSIWSLDLTTMAWSRLDPGAALSTGSWFRAAIWTSPSRGTNSLLIFGNRQGSLVEDYNRRLLAWDDVAVLDLEAFGIYQPPPRALDLRAQELGLAALEEELLADFEVVCDDGRRIPCSRRLLETRWPWFREQRRVLRDQATRVIASSPELSASANAAPPLPPEGELLPQPVPLTLSNQQQSTDARPDPRITPRALLLGEPYAVAMALLQYFYTLTLLTPLQHAPAVLSQLLLLGSAYNLGHLQQLVRHAMHRALAPATSVGVYEVATLCGCQSLQIRALKAVMASSRRNTGRARGTSNAGGGGAGGGGTGGGGNNDGGGPPRGGGGATDPRDRSNSDLQSSASTGLGFGTAGRARGVSDVRGYNTSGRTTVRDAGASKVAELGANGDLNGNLKTNGVSPLGLGMPEETDRDEGRDAMWPEDVFPDAVSTSDVDVPAGCGVDDGDESEISGGETETEVQLNVGRSLVGEDEGREEDEGEDGNRAATPTPTAVSTSASDAITQLQVQPRPRAEARRARIKHSVNLSMDSMYLALQAADTDADANAESGRCAGFAGDSSASASDVDTEETSTSPPQSAVDLLPPYPLPLPLAPLSIPVAERVPLSPRIPPPTSPSALSPVPRSPGTDMEQDFMREAEQHRREALVASSSVTEAEMDVNKDKDVETASLVPSLPPARRRAYTALADLAIMGLDFPKSPPSPSAMSSNNPSPRSSLLISSASMYASGSRSVQPSPSPSPGAATPLPYCSASTPPRRDYGDDTPERRSSLAISADDFDWRAVEGSSSTSRSPRPSPLTPDSPPLPTPGGSSNVSKHTSLSSYAISEEEALYEVQQRNGSNFHAFSSLGSGSRSRSPLLSPGAAPGSPAMRNWPSRSQGSHTSGSSASASQGVPTPQSATFGQIGQANGPTSHPHVLSKDACSAHGVDNDKVYGRRGRVNLVVDIVEPEPETTDGGQTARWQDLQIRAPRSAEPGQKSPPLSPPYQHHQHHSYDKNYSSPPISAPPVLSGASPQLPSPNTTSFATNLSPKSVDTERRSSASSTNTTGGGGFLSKARNKVKKKDAHVNLNLSSPSGSPLAPTFVPSINGTASIADTSSVASGWADARELKKAAKAEEKRRKKAEEKARLEALAAQFSQQRAKKEKTDEASAASTNSSERRRLANEWVEDSPGMYGAGGVQVWGGL